MGSVEVRKKIRQVVSSALILFLTACSTKGIATLTPLPVNKAPTPISVPTPEFETNSCEETPEGPGKLFHQVVNWEDSGRHKEKGSVQDLYGAYTTKDGKIRESGEVWGFCWVFGPDGERYYFDDVSQLTPESNPKSTSTPTSTSTP